MRSVILEVSNDVLVQIDAAAKAEGLSRPKWLIATIERALDGPPPPPPPAPVVFEVTHTEPSTVVGTVVGGATTHAWQ